MRQCLAVLCFIVVTASQAVAQSTFNTDTAFHAAPIVPLEDVPSYSEAVPQQLTTLSAKSIGEIEAQARADAHADIKGDTWLLIGCLTNLTGWLIAYVVEPSPPVIRLLGKSPEYVAVYSDTYKREGKKIQTSKALTGCIVSTLLVAVLETIFIIIAMNSEPAYYQ